METRAGARNKVRKIGNGGPADQPPDPAPTSSNSSTAADEVLMSGQDQEGDKQVVTVTPLGRAAIEAMRNHVVLAKIKKKLPTKLLLQLRQVCSTWNQTFVDELRAHIHQEITLESAGQMEEYTNLMRSSQGIPFGRYSLGDGEANQDFFAVCGKSIRCLTLYYDSCLHPSPSEEASKIEILHRIIFEQALELVELDLTLYGVEAEDLDQNPSREHTDTDRYLRKQLAKLKILTLFCGLTLPPSSANLLSNLMRSAVKLKNLDLSSNDPALLRLLLELGSRHQGALRLVKFEVYQPGKLELTNLLHSFLRTQSPSLRELKLTVPDLTDSGESELKAPLRVPKMDGLQAFMVEGSDTFSESKLFPIQFDEGTLADTFPRLERLECHREYACSSRFTDKSDSEEEEEGAEEESPDFTLEMNLLRHDHVTDFGLSLDIQKIPETRFSKLATLFPSVTSLQLTPLGVAVDTYAPIFTTWPLLAELHLEFSGLNYNSRKAGGGNRVQVDSFITGVREEARSAMKREMYSILGRRLKDRKPITMDIIEQLLDKYKSEAGIADLKHLCKFTMEIPRRSCDGSDRLTDFAGYFGFAVASHSLQHLELTCSESYTGGLHTTSYPGVRISPECRSFIRSALGSAIVIEIV